MNAVNNGGKLGAASGRANVLASGEALASARRLKDDNFSSEHAKEYVVNIPSVY